jgi:hypothetical protein
MMLIMIDIGQIDKITAMLDTSDSFDTTTIEKVKKGDYFKLKPESNIVYVRGDYNRFTKRYEAYKFEDINSFREFKKGKEVIIGFTF